MTQDIVPTQPWAPVVKKAYEVVMARESADLDLVDGKMFTYLLHRAYKDLKEKQIHRVPVQDVLSFLRHTSTSRLQESLRRLATLKLSIEYADENKERHFVDAHFLSYDMTMTEDGMLHYAFDPILLDFLHEPKVFAFINVNYMQSFRSRYARKLYEILAAYERRFSPVWTVSVSQLRQILGVPDDLHQRFDNFRRKVLDQAVQEIIEHTEFDVQMDFIRGGRGGKVVNISFKVSPKLHPRMVESPNVSDPIGRSKGKSKRDPNTPDMLDGRTDSERGAPPALQATTVREAAELLGKDRDVSTYEEEWRQEMSGRRVRDPDLSFLRWLNLRLEREEDEMLADLDDDTFGSLLERME